MLCGHPLTESGRPLTESAPPAAQGSYPNWNRPDGTPVMETAAPLKAGAPAMVYYNSGATSMHGQQELLMLTGINGWASSLEVPMVKCEEKGEHWFQGEVPLGKEVSARRPPSLARAHASARAMTAKLDRCGLCGVNLLRFRCRQRAGSRKALSVTHMSTRTDSSSRQILLLRDWSVYESIGGLSNPAPGPGGQAYVLDIVITNSSKTVFDNNDRQDYHLQVDATELVGPCLSAGAPVGVFPP